MSKEVGLPIKILMGRLEGVSKKDAKNYCINLIEKYIDDPDTSFYRVKKHQDAFFYEIHQSGSGKSYLDSLIKLLDEQEGHVEVILPSSTNYIKVVKDGGFISLHLLPESERPEITDGVSAGAKMTANVKTASNFLRIGLSSLIISALTLASASVHHAISYSPNLDEKKAVPYVDLHRAISEMETLRINNPEKYISKLFLKDGIWDMETKDVKVNYKESVRQASENGEGK